MVDEPNDGNGLRKKVTELASQWLDERFGSGRDGESGEARLTDLAARAEEFVSGFFRGLMDEAGGKEPTEGGVAGTPRPARSLSEVLPALDEVTRLVARTTRTVNDSFQGYLREHVAQEDPTEPVVIDGKFVVRHGTQILGRVIQALGSALAEPEKAAAEPSSESPRVGVKLDVAGLFRSLVLGRPAPTEAGPQAAFPTEEDVGEET